MGSVIVPSGGVSNASETATVARAADWARGVVWMIRPPSTTADQIPMSGIVSVAEPRMSCSTNRVAADAESFPVGADGNDPVVAVEADGGVTVGVEVACRVAVDASGAGAGVVAAVGCVRVGVVDRWLRCGVWLQPVARDRMRSAAVRFRMNRYSSCEWSLRTF